MARCVLFPSLSQLQWADKRSRVHFKCAICIWNLLLSTVKMRSKELSLSVKQAIIRLKKQNKPIREIAKTLGVAKTTVWNILKKKERTGELSNTKRPGRPRKTTVVDDRRILSLVKKTPFTTVGQIKNTLQEVASGDVYAFQTSGCNWLQRICNQVLKSKSLIYDYYSVPLLLVP